MLLVNAQVGASAIHGLGLFAKQFIPAGTAIWRFAPSFDVVIPEEMLSELSSTAQEQVRHYAEYFPAERKFVLSSDDDRFTNHSDNPNTASHGGKTSFAVRDINEGEEITHDYREMVMVGFRPDPKP